MIRAALILMVCAIVVGCARPSERHDFEPAPALSEAQAVTTYDFEGTWANIETSVIEQGFAEWPRETHTTVHVWRVTSATPYADHCPAVDFLGGAEMLEGYAIGNNDICLYMDEIGDLSLNELRIVSAHEYGHALGLGHYAGPEPSVMKGNADLCADAVQPVDVANLDEVK